MATEQAHPTAVRHGGWLDFAWSDGHVSAQFHLQANGRLIPMALHIEPGREINSTLIRQLSVTSLEAIANSQPWRSLLIENITVRQWARAGLLR